MGSALPGELAASLSSVSSSKSVIDTFRKECIGPRFNPPDRSICAERTDSIKGTNKESFISSNTILPAASSSDGLGADGLEGILSS